MIKSIKQEMDEIFGNDGIINNSHMTKEDCDTMEKYLEETVECHFCHNNVKRRNSHEIDDDGLVIVCEDCI